MTELLIKGPTYNFVVNSSSGYRYADNVETNSAVSFRRRPRWRVALGWADDIFFDAFHWEDASGHHTVCCISHLPVDSVHPIAASGIDEAPLTSEADPRGSVQRVDRLAQPVSPELLGLVPVEMQPG
jgi:hypothetical protein